jgi:enoyl-CoA hydratase/carnithine racemase
LPELLADRTASGVLVLTFNRADKLNALTASLIEALQEAVDLAEAEPVIRGIVLTGAGRAFSAGADIPSFVASLDESVEAALRDIVQRGQELTRRIEASRKPVICAVNGLAYGGGCELVEASHLAVASEDATFAKAEINIGIIPVFGGTQRLPRHIGRKKALELILTGAPISAVAAERLGLINRVVPEGQALDTAVRLAEQIGSHPLRTVGAALAAVTNGLDKPIDEALAIEAEAFRRMAADPGTNALLRSFALRGGGRPGFSEPNS